MDKHAHELDDVADVDQQVHAQDQPDEVSIFELTVYVLKSPETKKYWVCTFSVNVMDEQDDTVSKRVCVADKSVDALDQSLAVDNMS